MQIHRLHPVQRPDHRHRLSGTGAHAVPDRPDLGLALAKGVVLSLVTVFTFMPALTLAAYQWMDKTHHRPLLPSFDKFGRFVARIMLPMALVLVILMVPSYLASNSNQYYYGAAHMFGENTRLGADTAAIEETFGRSDTYVVLVPEGDTATQQKLSDALHAIPEVTGILSYVDNAGASIPPEFVPGDTLGLLAPAATPAWCLRWMPTPRAMRPLRWWSGCAPRCSNITRTIIIWPVRA